MKTIFLGVFFTLFINRDMPSEPSIFDSYAGDYYLEEEVRLGFCRNTTGCCYPIQYFMDHRGVIVSIHIDGQTFLGFSQVCMDEFCQTRMETARQHLGQQLRSAFPDIRNQERPSEQCPRRSLEFNTIDAG
jgi:hypothetical protein